jgi:hypothetical protein
MSTSIIDERAPLALQSNKVNIANHLKAIKENGLGPADPRQPNIAFWQAKGKKWGITEGDARGHLCSNCEHYLATTDIQNAIDDGPAKNFKASDVDPSLVDIESKPVAYCMLLKITCSPVRTCDEQELGGPIDDAKAGMLNAAKQYDLEEFDDPFADTTD